MEIILKFGALKEVFDFCKHFKESKNDIRPTSTLVHLEFNNGVCKAYALDNFKACVKTVPCEGNDGSMNIPIVDLPKMLKDHEVRISDDGKNITFDFISENRICKKIEGEFFNVKAAFPTKEPIFSISFSPKVLAEALKGFNRNERIDIDFFGPLSACKISQGNSEAIVLPVKGRKKDKNDEL